MADNYKEGDVVMLNSVVTEDMRKWWASPDMDYLLGGVYTIYRTSGFYVSFVEDIDEWTIKVDGIYSLATPEAIEQRRLEEEQKIIEKRNLRKELIEKHKDVLFDSEKVGAVAIDIFGEDRVEISDGENVFNITIHFPELILTNSKGQFHTIKDLFILLEVFPNIDAISSESGYRGCIEFKGRKSSFSFKEWESGYIHSHLQSGRFDCFANFCLGSSAFRGLLEDTMLSMSEEAWTTLFLSIPNYLRWESLEGGPHYKMGEIRYKKSTERKDLQGEAIKLIPKLPNNVWEISDKLSIIPSHPELYNYFNSFSCIRKLNTYTKEEYDGLFKNAQDSIDQIFQDYPLIWKGVEVAPVIYKETVAEDVQIERGVVEIYTDILNDMSRGFLKQKQYDTRKQKNSEKVFGETRTFQQTKIDNNEGAEEENRLPAF